ncbi:MAG: tetratricopeptide repeat protein [Calothrix sp. SM1_5_4]|nr:tetratricopeptide repeat protein [Calothrix sp. SM1_5_4]
MKKLLYCQIVLCLALTSACTSIEQRGGHLHDSALSNINPAPARMSPPDYNNSGPPVLDETYLGSQADFHFTMGETFSNEGQSARAVEEYKSTLIYDPKSIHVRRRLAQEYVRLGLITEAMEQAQVAVDMAPDDIESRMLLGGLYMGLKAYASARDQFEAILTKNPGHPEAAVYVGALLAEDRKYEESIKYFEALAKNKDFKETERAFYYIGRVRAEQGESHYGEAHKAFNKALVLKPEFPEAAVALASLLRAQSRLKEMETVLRSYQEKFGPEREMARRLGQYYLETEQFDRALDQLEILDGFERDNLNVKIQIALILIEQKSYEPAATRLEDVLQQAPDSDKVRYYLGAVYEEIKKPDLAIQHYGQIPAGSAYFKEAVIHQAHLLKNTRRLNKALEVVERALKAQDDLPELYAYYATLLDEQKDFKKAASMLSQAVTRFPANTQLRFFSAPCTTAWATRKGRSPR